MRVHLLTNIFIVKKKSFTLNFFSHHIFINFLSNFRYQWFKWILWPSHCISLEKNDIIFFCKLNIFFIFSQFAAFIRITWVETVNLRNKAKKIYWLGKNVRWDFKMCWERLQPRLITIIAWQKSNFTNFICQVRHLESRNWKECFTYDMKQFSDLIKYESE